VKLKFGIENVVEIMGRVVFDIEQDRINDVLKLRTPDNIWVIIGTQSNLDFTGPVEEGLDTLAQFAINNLSWAKGLDSWNKVFVSNVFIAAALMIALLLLLLLALFIL
jgi:hypothetical protein